MRGRLLGTARGKGDNDFNGSGQTKQRTIVSVSTPGQAQTVRPQGAIFARLLSLCSKLKRAIRTRANREFWNMRFAESLEECGNA